MGSNSPAPTVLRVKRRINEDPSDILLLAAKRRKQDDSQGSEDVKILKLAGTVNDGDELEINKSLSKILRQRNAPNFAELKEKYKQRRNDLNSTESRGKIKKEERGEERFKILSTNRSIKLEELEPWPESGSDKSPDSESSPLIHLVDLVKEQNSTKKPTEARVPEKLSCNGVEMIREYVSKPATNEDDYVYDVYYAEGDCLADFDDSLLDGLISLQPFNTGTDLVYDEYRDDPLEFRYEDDEDSNDEDNDRNEYPDEDDDEDDYRCDEFGDYYEELGTRMGRVRMCEEEEDLSSDSEDELVFTRSFEEDANRHGRGYARYKQQMLKEFKEDDLLDDSEDELDDEDRYHDLDYF